MEKNCTTSCVEKAAELILEQKNMIHRLKQELQQKEERITKAIGVYRENQRTIEELRRDNDRLKKQYNTLHRTFAKTLKALDVESEPVIDFGSDDDFEFNI